MTGATTALPRTRAIRSASTLTRALCLPSARCGPLCSVPPIGTMTVVLPAATAVRNSVHVSSSRNTVSGWAVADVMSAVSTQTSGDHRTKKRVVKRRAITGRRAPPDPASAEPHRAESCDPLLGRGMRGEQPREALCAQRIDDEQVRRCRSGRQGLDARGDLDLLERLGEAIRATG